MRIVRNLATAKYSNEKKPCYASTPCHWRPGRDDDGFMRKIRFKALHNLALTEATSAFAFSFKTVRSVSKVPLTLHEVLTPPQDLA